MIKDDLQENTRHKSAKTREKIEKIGFFALFSRVFPPFTAEFARTLQCLSPVATIERYTMATLFEALSTAVQHHQAGRLQAAEQLYRQILEVLPNQPDAHHLLGVLVSQLGKRELAIQYIQRAIALQGDAFAYHNNLGGVYHGLQRFAEAAACFRRALELKPDFAPAHYNLGNTLKDQGQRDEALACYRRALELDPNYTDAHFNLGAVLKEQGALPEAVACYRRALQLKPDYAEVHSNLGNALREQGNLGEAVGSYRRALELKPDYAEAHSNLGNVLKDLGQLDEALACYRRALELKPDCAEAHSNLLLVLQYCPAVTLAALAEAHAEYDRRQAAPLRGPVVEREKIRTREGPLRVGFVSPDLGRHPVGYFLVRVLENVNRQRLETTCYSDRVVKDDLTHRLQAAATHWCDVRGLSDQRLAEQIAADRIDILFDLAGHTSRNRLLSFARKPAPRQITWIGYEGTTGLSAMDYLLADRYVVPEGSERHYREQVLRMPDSYLCYDPPQMAPPVGPLPASARGEVTFASLNNPAKITPEVVRVWAEILRRVPAARLMLKYRGFGDADVQQRFRASFARCGVGPERLTLLPASSYFDYLTAYQQIDLALDPFPFSGGVTTCEALWMGVPVITCPGETFASRHGLSYMSNIGLTETIAGGLEEYVDLAVRLAGDLSHLSPLRAGLRPQMADSPLCDGKRFAAHWMSLLEELWTGGTR
jgi:predicted O-linked N-acetylglucosamine transferase (SPINDLY family)